MDFKDLEEKWQKKWKDEKVFESSPDNRKKFFLTFPYPYINAYSHLGHLFTSTRVEAFSRYKRLKGYNVLFAQGWHATGSPIVQAAKRVKEREPKQIKIMQDMGFTENDFSKFEKPEYWIEFFAPEFKKDFENAGLSIDWRREFFTTQLNPRYDKFIRWQLEKLREKNYVVKGKFPVVFDPKTNMPVGDHDRIEGEGETPQEFTLLKFKLKDSTDFLIAATLRPETMFGQTNLWVNPEIVYKKAKVNGETWIISGVCAEKLTHQDHKVELIGDVPGKELIGKHVLAPMINKEIPVLPASFCKEDKGSGIVTSVPSDAPDDWMGLVDLKNNPSELEKYGLAKDTIEHIKIIPIINSADLGNQAAITICEQMKIKSSKDRDKLEEAKKIVYKKGFYEGTMLESTGKYFGMKVEAAKEAIKKDLLEQKKAEIFYELTGKVVSRSLTVCIVKIVSDQWFIDYANPEWKKLAHECLDEMKLYPDKTRQQFNYVLDWLRAWACTREAGLGTKLPWDEKWLIESLSDSTIYMAYYTINHILNDIPLDQIDNNLFDHVLLGKKVPIKCDHNKAEQMSAEFNYWYPLDFRNSGKDLVQNHLSFFIFNHVAIFPKDKWPKGIGVNGHITVDGQKMSKSLGNFILMRDALKAYGADAARFTIVSGGEGIDDSNFDSELARSMTQKIEQVLEFAVNNHDKGRLDRKSIDDWMESKLNIAIKEAEISMEETLYRTALQKVYFETQRNTAWYLKRSNNNPNKELMNKIIESQLIMLTPFTPHMCEEAWEKIGKAGFITNASWPEFDESKIQSQDTESFVRDIIDDVNAVLKLAKIDAPKKIKLFIAGKWKYELYKLMREKLVETRSQKDIIDAIMKSELKKHGQEVMKVVPKILKTGSVPDCTTQDSEHRIVEDAKEFLKENFNASIELYLEENTQEAKAKNAMPAKPAILVE